MKKRTTKPAARIKAPVKEPTLRRPKPASATVAVVKKPQTVAVTVKTSRWGKDDPSYQKLEVPVDADEKATIELTINLRETDYVEVRPVRRAMTDVKGLIKDAERLANQI